MVQAYEPRALVNDSGVRQTWILILETLPTSRMTFDYPGSLSSRDIKINDFCTLVFLAVPFTA